MVNLLKEHGIYVYRLSKDTVVNARNFKKGDIVVPLAQPFRAFVKEVMEAQEYPVRHYTPGGKIIRPYDITSWSLPLHRGIDSFEINDKTHLPADFDSLLEKIEGDFRIGEAMPRKFAGVLLTVNRNESFKAAFAAMAKGLTVFRLTEAAKVAGKDFPIGSFLIYGPGKAGFVLKNLARQLSVSPAFIGQDVKLKSKRIKLPRIALVESFFHDMDAGWTRFVFDSYSIPFKVLRPGDFKTANLKNFDVIVFPGEDKEILMSGKNKYLGQYYISDYPPEYVKGMGKDGLNKVMAFLDGGGVIVSWGDSTELFMGMKEITIGKTKEAFQLPVRDISKQVKKAGLYCPGSLMKLDVKQGHAITLGMQKQIGVFFRGAPVFRTTFPYFDMDRRVIGKFPEKNILLSGYCEKQEAVGNKTALAWIKKNKGQLVLFGFHPQFRASTQAAYKLLFNSLLLK
jgi:hypothetical protein